MRRTCTIVEPFSLFLENLVKVWRMYNIRPVLELKYPSRFSLVEKSSFEGGTLRPGGNLFPGAVFIVGGLVTSYIIDIIVIICRRFSGLTRRRGHLVGVNGFHVGELFVRCRSSRELVQLVGTSLSLLLFAFHPTEKITGMKATWKNTVGVKVHKIYPWPIRIVLSDNVSPRDFNLIVA